MSEPFGLGSRVRVRAADPAHHTRAPRYARGHVGVVVEAQASCLLPDDLFSRSGPARCQTVYAVRFTAEELWGAGDHRVIVHCWEDYLEPVTDQTPGDASSVTDEESA